MSLLPKVIVVVLILLAAGHAIRGQQPAGETERGGAVARRLAPTVHPSLPNAPSQYWLLPERPATTPPSGARAEDPVARLSRAARLIGEEQYGAALPLIAAELLAPTALADYAQYYRSVALAGLGRFEEADRVLTVLNSRRPEGHLRQAIALQLATVALRRGDAARALTVLESTGSAPIAPENVALRIGEAAEAAGNTQRALEAYRTVYYDHPLSPEAADAQTGIQRLEAPSLIPADRFTRELARAERLFTARRWAQARAGFEPLARAATSEDDRELIALRLAETDYYLDRHRAARDALVPYLDDASREAEARFFHLTATRALGERAAYLRLARGLIDEFPDSSWAEETLNNLASHYIVDNDDEAADRVFRELAQKFPRSRHGERAAWKIGWLAYKKDRFVDAAETFEAAAAAYPRADTRPAWLYWSGRARDQSGDSELANARYRLTTTDYQNSYYGRLASRVLAERKAPAVAPSVGPRDGAAMPSAIPTDALIRQLVAAGMYTDALNELQYAQRRWGDSPTLQATVAWIRHEMGLEQESMERFQNMRGAITQMKRAYPQYLAAGGEHLPPDVLRVMFPLDYWGAIRKYAAQHNLDPHLMAALVAQESTFTADIRSSANAYGLMQLLPSAGRQYARKVGLRYSLSLLSNPDANLRMGMAYFRDLSNRFGSDHYALAGYNAGPHRVVRWIAERPGVATDEFIDDIPFPETQNYVKRILGQAEDYRRLYGGGVLTPRR